MHLKVINAGQGEVEEATGRVPGGSCLQTAGAASQSLRGLQENRSEARAAMSQLARGRGIASDGFPDGVPQGQEGAYFPHRGRPGTLKLDCYSDKGQGTPSQATAPSVSTLSDLVGGGSDHPKKNQCIKEEGA